jgi:histidine triad (HIT) family protein
VSHDSHDPTCLFCKIVRGEIPSARVLETDDVVAFLDLSPVNLGHVLLVPKAHHSSLFDLPDEIAAEVGRLVPRLARAVRAATGADGLNLIVNNGRAAGQTVDHGHWHFIPRSVDDAVDWPWPHLGYPEGEMDRMRARIEGVLSGDGF